MSLNWQKCFVFFAFSIFCTCELRVTGALALETASKAKELLPIRFHTYHKDCDRNYHCVGPNERCDSEINKCMCQPYYQYLDNACYPCPSESSHCTECCSGPHLQCIDKICIGYSTNEMLMTASQIALSAALIMGAVALATLLYRVCTKPSYFGRTRRIRFNRNTTNRESAFQRISRTSLSSIQIRVLSRLRDRPPKYETQHNYDTRLQRQEEEEVQRARADSNSTPTIIAVSTVAHAPPAYDGSTESVNESPPPYSDRLHATAAEGSESFGMSTVQHATPHRTEQSNESDVNITVSIISNSCVDKDVIGANTSAESDHKVDKSIHM